MFPIWINDGKNPKPTEKIFYELAGNGFFLHKKTKFWDVVVPVKNISILENSEESLEMHIPAIQKSVVHEVARFFAWVAREYRSEVAVILWYNPSTQDYDVTVPPQKISGGSVQYDVPRTGPAGMVMIGSIHSHQSMMAFHSGTDMHDEENFDGLHFTFGSFGNWNAGKDKFSIAATVAINGTRFRIKPTEWLDGIVAFEEKDEAPYWQYQREKQYYYSLTNEIVPTEKNDGDTSGNADDKAKNTKKKDIKVLRLLPEDYLPLLAWRSVLEPTSILQKIFTPPARARHNDVPPIIKDIQPDVFVEPTMESLVKPELTDGQPGDITRK